MIRPFAVPTRGSALYEPDATFVPEPGRTVRGTDAIRVELERFAALRPRITGTIEHVIEASDTALVINRWQLRGTGPDGATVEMSARSTSLIGAIHQRPHHHGA